MSKTNTTLVAPSVPGPESASNELGLPTIPPKADDTAAFSANNASYMQRVTIDIPAELLVAYLMIKGLLDGQPTQHYWVYYGTIAFLAVLVPLYMKSFKGIKSRKRQFCGFVSFILWSICLGGQHVGRFEEFVPAYASVALIMWSLFLAWYLYDSASDDGARAGG